jgi:hypothetical protein
VADVQASRRRFGEPGWPADPAARRRLGPLADALDAAFLARDLGRLRQAAGAFLAAVGGDEGAEGKTDVASR